MKKTHKNRIPKHPLQSITQKRFQKDIKTLVCKECYAEVPAIEGLCSIHKNQKGNKCAGSRKEGFDSVNFWQKARDGQ